MKKLLFILALLFCSHVALAQVNYALEPRKTDGIMYVSATGSDTNDGLSPGSAKLTIGGACAGLPGGNSSCSAGYGNIIVEGPVVAVNSTVTITSTIGLQIQPGTLLNIASAITLTIDGPFTAAQTQQLFEGTGSVVINNGLPISASWFPGATILDKINAAYAALNGNVGQIVVPANVPSYPSSNDCSNNPSTCSITGPSVIPPIANAQLYISPSGSDSNNGLTWGTAMATPQAAYNALPSTGGWISAACGTYGFSTGITFATNLKPVKFVGSGPCTVLNYTGSSGTALLLDTGGGNPAHPSYLSDFTLQTTVSGSTATGLQVGATNTAKASVIDGVSVDGFQNDIYLNAFGIYWNNVEANGCSTASGSSAVLVGSIQDDNHFTGGQFAGCDNVFVMTGGANGPVHFIGTEFYSTVAGATILDIGGNNFVECTNCHLVQESGAGQPDFFNLQTNAQLLATDTIFEDDTSSGSYAYDAQASGTSSLGLVNCRFTASGATVTGETINLSGSVMANFFGIVNAPGGSPNPPLWNTSYTGGPVTNFPGLDVNAPAPAIYNRNLAVYGANFVGDSDGNNGNLGALQFQNGGTLEASVGLNGNNHVAIQGPGVGSAGLIPPASGYYQEFTFPNATGTLALQGNTCTMSSGTSCTSTVSYGAHCVATVQGTAVIAGACQISGTTLTVTAASSNSDTWAWIIVN